LLGLLSAALLAAALLLAGRRQTKGEPALAAPVVALLLLVAVPLFGIGRGEMAVTQRGDAGEAWSEAKVAAARAAGRPVFVYFTADWCLSCKVNEASTIDREPVRDALKGANAEVLVADWTNADPGHHPLSR
jgi:thiol:disulfide interchange protein